MKKEKVVGYGYVGRWLDGTLGWAMPTHVNGRYGRRGSNKPQKQDWNEGHKTELCKITVEPVKTKDGRKIIRKIK